MTAHAHAPIGRLFPLLALVVVLAFSVPAVFAQNANVAAAIAEPMAALDRALAEEARLPLTASDRERLERMGAVDQSWRLYMGKLPLDRLSPEEVKIAFAAIVARTKPIDQRNRDAVMRMLPKQGWFSFTAYGRAAAEGAFHIINHSDFDTMRQVLPAIERMAMAGEANRHDFAKMYDRIRKGEGKPQRYGTQFDCVDHRPVPYRLEDPARVEVFRKSMGFGFSLADQLRQQAERGARC